MVLPSLCQSKELLHKKATLWIGGCLQKWSNRFVTSR